MANIGEEEEELDASERLSETLPLPDGERYECVHLLELSAGVQEALGAELHRLREDLSSNYGLITSEMGANRHRMLAFLSWVQLEIGLIFWKSKSE